jgi:hypothetical protein
MEAPRPVEQKPQPLLQKPKPVTTQRHNFAYPAAVKVPVEEKKTNITPIRESGPQN